MLAEIEIELNEYGKAIFQHLRKPHIFAHRAYKWVDRVILIDESDGRRVLDDKTYSSLDDELWRPVTVKEYRSIKSYKELIK